MTALFPGCSLSGSGRELESSLRLVAAALGAELREIDDWACCGASSAHVTSDLLAVALPARTLALARAQGHDRILAPCAACYSRLSGAARRLAAEADTARRIEELSGAARGVAVESLVDFLGAREAEIRARARRPVGFKVACYYGCLLVRPPAAPGAEVERPTAMEEIARAAGAEPVAWHLATECCGGGFSLARPASVLRLGRRIIDAARAAGAAAIVVACPMCHTNLDFRGRAAVGRGEAPLPVLYLTELVGLALGLDAGALGLGRHYVDAGALCRRLLPEAAHE